MLCDERGDSARPNQASERSSWTPDREPLNSSQYPVVGALQHGHFCLGNRLRQLIPARCASPTATGITATWAKLLDDLLLPSITDLLSSPRSKTS